jgi:hypothetical protein
MHRCSVTEFRYSLMFQSCTLLYLSLFPFAAWDFRGGRLRSGIDHLLGEVFSLGTAKVQVMLLPFPSALFSVCEVGRHH